MELDRRRFLATSGACLASCGGHTLRGAPVPAGRLDTLLAAHSEALPERAGAGANHYPMAAEALEAMGFEDRIEEAWIRGASSYAGPLPRSASLDGDRGGVGALGAFGAYERYGDWLDLFRRALDEAPWQTVLATWAPRLAPGIAAAAFHGVIRTAHAARALRHRETAPRRNELAIGLAYWAARYVELPVDPSLDRHVALADLVFPWLDDDADVDFFAVTQRMTARPLAPRVSLDARASSPRADLELLVQEAAAAFLEMLVLERQRIWLLHMVTGPAAVELLLPDVDAAGARALVVYARQSVVAMFAAFGAPYTARAHLRELPGEWPSMTLRAAESRSVHTIKLIEALARFDRGDDPLLRSVAAQWLEWR